MRALAWVLALSIATAGAGAAALLVYSLAIERPRDLRTADRYAMGPSDEQVRHLDPNAGMFGESPAPLRPNELRQLDVDPAAGKTVPNEPTAPAKSWLVSSSYKDGQAAEGLAKALVSKGAPDDLIFIVRVAGESTVDWRVEIGPITDSQAAVVQSLLQNEGLDFELH